MLAKSDGPHPRSLLLRYPCFRRMTSDRAGTSQVSEAVSVCDATYWAAVLVSTGECP